MLFTKSVGLTGEWTTSESPTLHLHFHISNSGPDFSGAIEIERYPRQANTGTFNAHE